MNTDATIQNRDIVNVSEKGINALKEIASCNGCDILVLTENNMPGGSVMFGPCFEICTNFFFLYPQAPKELKGTIFSVLGNDKIKGEM